MRDSVDPDRVRVRRAIPADALAIAEVWLRSYWAQYPTVKRPHTDDQVREWIATSVIPDQETWVAIVGDELAALMSLDIDLLDQLYVDPDWQGRGIGSQLVALAKERRPAGLGLWTFQANLRARGFYARRGFVERELTDGSGNEEHEPDVRMEWRPRPHDR